MRALICGSGVAGPALAWHLERAGWDVETVERSARFRDGGFMIDFYGPGYEVAERMGLADRLQAVRHPVEEVVYVDAHGRRTGGLTMSPNLTRVVSLLREDLARVILDDVRSPVRYGTGVAAVEQDGSAVRVRLTDGTEREVDLLVGADGAHSGVRALVFGPEDRFARYLGHHVAAYVVRDGALSERVGTRYRMLTVPGLMAGAYALGDDRLAALFLRREPDPAIPANPSRALREAYGGLGWIVPELLGHRPSPPELYYDRVTQVEMDRWSAGRVVLLGDACQAVSLFAGHGASMAMTGARVLADELAGAGPEAVPAALERYERRMRPRIREVQAFGRRFIRWMAPSSRLRIVARDRLLALASLPGADRLFLRALTPGGRSPIPE
ncbi:FAD-dependent oxidoreductase [Streptosporangium violaceochromogenes]|nr:FAD-dependent oxidoreductase [Streptosporangium violaceochromogenes]